MQTQTISILLNGEATDVDRNSTITDVLKTLDIEAENTRGIAVAVGDEVVSKEQWSSWKVADGEEVEVITATQGG